MKNKPISLISIRKLNRAYTVTQQHSIFCGGTTTSRPRNRGHGRGWWRPYMGRSLEPWACVPTCSRTLFSCECEQPLRGECAAYTRLSCPDSLPTCKVRYATMCIGKYLSSLQEVYRFRCHYNFLDFLSNFVFVKYSRH